MGVYLSRSHKTKRTNGASKVQYINQRFLRNCRNDLKEMQVEADVDEQI